MKKINKLGSLLSATIIAMATLFTACDPENITTETYDFPDVYVALIRVSPTEAVPLSDITIEGNDLDHVKAVRFWNDEGSLDIAKAAFKVHKKDSIVVNVPENAPVGKISVLTNDDKLVTWLRGMTDKLITVSDITPTLVAEKDEITLTGTNFDLVKAVRFSKGENSMVVPKTNFIAVSPEDGTIVLAIPEGAPVDKVSVITDYDQMVMWSGSLTERVLSVTGYSPKETVVVGTVITVQVTNSDLIKSVTFGSVPASYAEEEEGTLLITIPGNLAAGKYALNINTWKGITKVADFDIVRLSLDPVWDAAHVYFDFDGKNSWWGDCPQTIEDDPEYSISGAYFHVKATASAGWYGLFWRNAGNDLNVSSVNVENWEVKYDINVLGTSIPSVKIRLGDFWYITDVNPNIGGWYTVAAPLSDFRNDNGNGRAMTDADIAALKNSGDFGMADGGSGGEYDVLIDNVRFESKTPYTDPVADPDLVIFDFEDRGDNNVANNSWDGVGKKSTDDGVSGAFYEITAGNWKEGAYWWISDNWCEAPFPTISGLSNHVIKMDVRLRQDIPEDDQVQIRLRISGNKEINFIPYIPVKSKKYTTFGSWITITIPCEDQGLSDPTTASGDWGIVKGWNPNNVNFTGFCVDNIRYEHK